MPSDKTKVKDSLSNVGNLKDQLNSVFKQIKLFQTRIDEMKNSSREEDLGYMRCFDLESRCTMMQSCHKSGKDPSKAAIFLTRTIVNTLCGGPLSERDIKTIVVDKCLELGIKSTNRGTIAGLNLDVSTVCSVLASIGVLEATSPVDPLSTEAVSSSSTSQRGFGEELCDSITARWEADITRYLAEFKRPDPIAAMDVSQQEALSSPPAFKAESTFFPQSGLDSTSFEASLMMDPDLSLMQSFDAQQDHSLLDLTSGSIGLLDHSFSEQLLNMVSPPPRNSTSGYFPRHSLLQDDADMFSSLSSPLLSPPLTTTATPSKRSAADSVPNMTSVREDSTENQQAHDDDQLLMASLRHYLGEEEEEGEGPEGDAPQDQNQGGEGGGGEDIHDSSFVLSMLSDSPLAPTTSNQHATSGERERTLSEDSIQMARDLLFHSTGGGGEDDEEDDLEGTTPAASSPVEGMGNEEEEEGSLSAALNDSDLMDSLMFNEQQPSCPSPHTTSSSTTAAVDNNGNNIMSSPAVPPVHFKMEGGGALQQQGTPCSTMTAGGGEYETESVCVSVQSSIKAGGSKTKGGSKAKSSAHKEGKSVGSGRRSAAVTRVWRIRSDLNDQLRRFVESSSSEPFKHVLLQPAPILDQWNTANSNAAAASEIEENLLRRLAGQCGLALKSAPYRLGTRYLDAAYQELLPDVTHMGIHQQQAGGGFGSDLLMDGSAASGGGLSSAAVNVLERQVSYTSMASHGESALSATAPGSRSRSGSNSSANNAVFSGGVQALYDDQVSITGSFLLDKIRRSKRQRGACLTSNGLTPPVFNNSYINTLSSICAHTTNGYWDDSLKFAAAVTSSSTAPSSSSSKGSGLLKGGKTASGSNNNNRGGLDVSALAGQHYPKHYSQPSLLVPDRGSGPPLVKLASTASQQANNSNGTTPSPTPTQPLILSAIHLPDLSVYSQEIPWSTIAKEFTVLGGEEAGAVFRDQHNNTAGDHSSSSSHSKAAGSSSVSKGGGGALQRTISKDAGSSGSGSTAEKHPNQYTNKKKSLSSSSASSNTLPLMSRSDSQIGLTASAESVSAVKKSLPLQLPTYDVAAPMFREVTPPSRTALSTPPGEVSNTSTEVEEEEEDISDEAVLARHDAVLRAMREKWALLQALKMEHSRRGSGGDYVSNNNKKNNSHSSSAHLLTAGIATVGEDGNPLVPAVHYSGSGSHMKYKKYLNTSSSTSNVNEGGGGGDGSSGSNNNNNKKRGYNMMSGGGGSNNLKRRGRPPKITKALHAAGISISGGVNGVLMPGGGAVLPLGTYVSQRGNNQYTAIRAAAAAAAYHAQQQQQMQLSDAVTSSSDVSSTGSLVPQDDGLIISQSVEMMDVDQQPSDETAPQQETSFNHLMNNNTNEEEEELNEPDDAQIEAALMLLESGSEGGGTDDEGEGRDSATASSNIKNKALIFE